VRELTKVNRGKHARSLSYITLSRFAVGSVDFPVKISLAQGKVGRFGPRTGNVQTPSGRMSALNTKLEIQKTDTKTRMQKEYDTCHD
jgi:hypothetical protein